MNAAEAPPILCTWRGGAFHPRARDILRLAEHFDEGEEVHATIEAVASDRADTSRRHFFATVRDLYQHLPERERERWPSADHLRKHGLIRGGFCDVRHVACSSKAEAARVANLARQMDEYAIVRIEGATVTVWQAWSQAKRAMGARQFQQSKQAVFDFLADALGVDPGSIHDQHRRGAAA